jgi:flagellar biosynthesis protein FliR
MDVNEFLVGTILAFARISSFLFFVPFLRGGFIPAMSKVVISLSLALIAGNQMGDVEVGSTLSFVLLLMSQILMGLTLAFFVDMFFQISQMAGSLMDFDMGLSMAEVVDPSNGRRTTVMANIFNILFVITFLSIGGIQTLIMSIMYSFKFTDINFFLGEAIFIELILAVFMYMMTATVQIALPFIATIFIVNFIFLIIGRAAPQINIFANMFIVKIALGFLFIYVTMPFLGEVFMQVNDNMNLKMFEIMEVMFKK